MWPLLPYSMSIVYIYILTFIQSFSCLNGLSFTYRARVINLRSCMTFVPDRSVPKRFSLSPVFSVPWTIHLWSTGPGPWRHTGDDSGETPKHWLINYIDTKAKCRQVKNFLWRDFAAGVKLAEAQSPIPPPHKTLKTFILIQTGKGGGENWSREKVRGPTVYKAE